MDDREFAKAMEEFSKDVRENLIPKLEISGTITSLWTGRIDVKIAVELGLAMLMDKPIVAMIEPGTPIPEKFARIVDEFVEWNPKNPGEASARFGAALDRVHRRAKGE